MDERQVQSESGLASRERGGSFQLLDPHHSSSPRNATAMSGDRAMSELSETRMEQGMEDYDLPSLFGGDVCA